MSLDLDLGLDGYEAREPCPFDEAEIDNPRWAHCCDGYGGTTPTRCGAHYPAHMSHCTVCHATFGGDSTFDRHRYGPWDSRGCRDAEWMAANGLRLDGDSIWHYDNQGKGTP